LNFPNSDSNGIRINLITTTTAAPSLQPGKPRIPACPKKTPPAILFTLESEHNAGPKATARNRSATLHPEFDPHKTEEPLIF